MASINQNIETKTSISVNGVDGFRFAEHFWLLLLPLWKVWIQRNLSFWRKSLKPLNAIVNAQEHVTTLFKTVKFRKADSPGAICGRTLHYCADQLSWVFTRLFQSCADLGQIPTIWKTSTIRPVALTSLVMKKLRRFQRSYCLLLMENSILCNLPTRQTKAWRTLNFQYWTQHINI